MFIHVNGLTVAEISSHRRGPACIGTCRLGRRRRSGNRVALTSQTSQTSQTETSETSADRHAAHGQGPSLPSATPPEGKPCAAGGSAQPAPGHRTDRRLGDASTDGQRILGPGTGRSRSALSQAHASCSSFRRKGAEHRLRDGASGPGGKTLRAPATERKALIFRALKHVFASAVCLTCHRGSYISRAPLGAYCGRSSVG
jgi:hypothetical protein